MKILLKKCTLHEPGKPAREKTDILIENGKIARIAKSISDDEAKVITSGNLHVSPGWLDIGAQHGQPGYEPRETIASLSKAALAGGYTALAPFPRTKPPIHSRIEIEFIQQLSRNVPVKIYPVGAVSEDLAGVDLTEMIDMIHAGAIAFTDGRKNPLSSGLLTRSMEYVSPYNSVIIDFPLDRNVTNEGQMHEGKFSTSLGLTGIPYVAEEIIVQRDLQLLKYTNSRLHLHAISFADTLNLIQKAKNQKLKVTADIGAMHLMLEDTDVGDFESHRKVLPPLRGSSNRKALIKAVKDGSVDHISSLHTPMEVETKACEFTYASFGSVGLESAFATAHTVLSDHMEVGDIVDKFCAGPYRILGLSEPTVTKDQLANLTMFDPDINWTYSGTKHSLSSNDALTGKQFKGKVLGVIIGKNSYMNT